MTMTAKEIRECKTVDQSVPFRHIGPHVDHNRTGQKDSKSDNPLAYVHELTGVIMAGKSMIDDLAYVMRRKDMNPEEVVLNVSKENAKTRVFSYFSKTDFDVANKIRYYLNTTTTDNIESLFTEEELQLQYNVLKRCVEDAFAAQLLFSEAASRM